MRYYMSNLSKTKNHVEMFSLGKTYKGRIQFGVKISSGLRGNPVIFVDAGIHAREWLAPATALYIIHQLAENASNANLYENIDWYIIPVLNPDGYQYTREVVSIKNSPFCGRVVSITLFQTVGQEFKPSVKYLHNLNMIKYNQNAT